MKQEHRRASGEGIVPDFGSLMRHVTGLSRNGQRCRPVCLEPLELEVGGVFDIYSLDLHLE